MGDQIDLFGGDDARKEGIERVLGNDQAHWLSAYRIVIGWFFDSLPVGATFRGENFRLFVMTYTEIGEPHHPNVWGAAARTVINELLQGERITRIGMAKAIATKNHSHQYALYQKLR